jgi:hypothetical protein
MKTIIWLLILIGWSVLQARRKAVRERERQQRARTPEPSATATPTYQRYPETARAEIPRELDAIMDYARSRVQSEATTRNIESMPYDAATQDAEVVTSIVPDVEESEYRPPSTDRGRRFTDLRTFFVMREVLGPPRAKKRFHPRLKAQE